MSSIIIGVFVCVNVRKKSKSIALVALKFGTSYYIGFPIPEDMYIMIVFDAYT